VLHGDREDRINRSEPLPAEGAIVPPRELDEYAQSVWDRLAPDLIAKSVLTAWDVDQFATFCESASTYKTAREHLNRDGLTAVGAAGGVIKSPYWQIMRDAADIMTKVGGRFGLTPSDRSSLSIGGGEDKAQGAARFLS
jgi:P27 family predicted phage terminase small subunit